ncbi:DNA-directed RNA polymerase I subunit rpa2 [Clydaea vesicula]|uniref:DNA-directed RNA polymerase I subunit rpa2 n=1 Tax=Clydaea vesicula TaxID=447962 RepID=A0AAD5U1D4_9FUNG|nr:DNA-directed RNA polymerase I subunit rpa2 [Clydaea vesicula]
MDVGQVCIVGRINSIQKTSTNTRFNVDDGTGQVDVTKWVEKSDNEDDMVSDEDAALQEGVYIKVFGNLRDYKGKRSIGAHKLILVLNPDMITYHNLEAIYVHLETMKGILPPLDLQNNNNFNTRINNDTRGPLNDNMRATGIGFSNQTNVGSNNIEDLITQVMQRYSVADVGISISDICFHLRDVFSEAEIRNKLGYLMNEGHIYETTDDNHITLA